MATNGYLIYPASGAFTISTGVYTSTTVPFLDSTAGGGAAVISRAIYVGVTGDLRVVMYDGSTGLFPATPAGFRHDIRAIALSSANTAGGLTGML